MRVEEWLLYLNVQQRLQPQTERAKVQNQTRCAAFEFYEGKITTMDSLLKVFCRSCLWSLRTHDS